MCVGSFLPRMASYLIRHSRVTRTPARHSPAAREPPGGGPKAMWRPIRLPFIGKNECNFSYHEVLLAFKEWISPAPARNPVEPATKVLVKRAEVLVEFDPQACRDWGSGPGVVLLECRVAERA